MSLKPKQTLVAANAPTLLVEERPVPPAEAPGQAATEDEAQPDPQPAKPKRGGGARGVALVILAGIAALICWYVITDRNAPYSAVGAVNASIAQVAPRVAGQVVSVDASDNQSVKQGDLLFGLDKRPFEIAVRQAEANYQQVLQTVGATNLSLPAVSAKLEQARASVDFALSIAERQRQMFANGLATQVQADKAESDLLAAQTALQVAQSDYDSALLRAGQGADSNPQVLAAAATLDQARLNLEFADVLAPSDGTITNLRLTEGQFINAGTPALTFISSARPWVMADFRESQLINVEPGDTVGIIFDGRPGAVFEGHVQGIASGIDPGRTMANGLPQNQSSARWFEPARTIPVHIELDGEEAWPANVRVGSKVSVVIYAAGEGNPIAWIANGLLHVQSFFSHLY